MGVDAGIFAKKAKAYYWFDRLKNLEQFENIEDEQTREVCENIFMSLRTGYGDQITAERIIDFLLWNAKACEVDRDGYQGWSYNCVDFIKAHPGDAYRIISDHDNDDVSYENLGFTKWLHPNERTLKYGP